MSLPRYESYKDSGVEWLGEVPVEWVTTPIKLVGRLKGGAGFPHGEQGIEGEELSFHKVNALGKATSDGFLLPSENTISRETALRLGAFIFPPSAIVFAKVGAALLLGRIRTIPDAACLDNNMMGLVVNEESHVVNFIRYAMNLVRFDLISNPGAVPSLNEAQIGNFPLVIPQKAEQQAIASFLDQETGKIDSLVSEQEKLIGLLKEKRQAVISHAVTKGLDPNAKMKDSGVEWLGEVPVDWEVVKIRRCLIEHRQGYYSTNPYTDSGVKLLRITDLRDHGTVSFEECPFVEYEEGIAPFLLQQEDFVFARTGGAGSFGVIDKISEMVAYASYLIRFRFNNTLISTDFLRFFFFSDCFQKAIKQNIHGGVNQNVHAEDIKDQYIAIPSMEEQSKIAIFLKHETSKIDALIEEAQKAINLMKERRTALISAAVTGKIDVRGLSPASIKPELEAV